MEFFCKFLITNRHTRANRTNSHHCNGLGVEDKVVEHFHQLLNFVLFQTDESVQIRRLLPGAVKAVNHVALLLLTDEQNVEHFQLK